MINKSHEDNENYQRVIVFLNREQVDFLDKLGKDTLFSGKKKLPRTKIISCLVDLLMDLNINGAEVATLGELKQKIKAAIGMSWPNTKELFLLSKDENKPEADQKEASNG